jgi:hydrogenase maturation protein HypF
MWQKGLNAPKSSSVGRLFDAVASLSGACQEQSYEGEAGLLTELKIKNEKLKIEDSFSYSIKNGVISIEWDFFDKDLVARFYATLSKIILDLAKKEQLPVLLSGGVFQNKTLLEFISQELEIANIEYYYNKTIPINDSGISVGQIWSVVYGKNF